MNATLSDRRIQRLPVVLVAVAVIGIAWALAAEFVRMQAGWPWTWVLLDVVPGIAFLACGCIARIRTPDSSIGWLMIATGFAWYAGTAATSGVDVVDRTTSAVQGFYEALLAWLILAYPSGRLMWRSSRVVVGALVTLLALRGLFLFVVVPQRTGLDVGNAVAVDRYVTLVTLRSQGEILFSIVAAALAVAVIALVLARWRAESRAGRAIAGPILLGGFGFALGIVVETLTVIDSKSFAERSFAWDVGRWLTVVTVSMVPVAFLVGLGQDRLARARVADLMVSLGGSTPQRSDLRDTLATTLGDPSLEIAYNVPGTDQFVDATGQAVSEVADHPNRGITRVDRDGKTVALLIHDPALNERPSLMTSVAAAAGLALENERLQAELRIQLAEVQASRARIVAAGDAERRRVERDLHDGAQQRLVTLALALQLARAGLGEDQERVAQMLERASIELETGLAELRDLARGLHPTVLTEAGLAAAVRAIADRSLTPVAVDVVEESFSPEVESSAYYVVAEALTNVARYGRGAAASVRVERRSDSLRVEVSDDGPGGARSYPGSGLQGLADRVAAAGGTFTVSSPIGAGTVVVAEIPCA